jgi:hypothetical protein
MIVAITNNTALALTALLPQTSSAGSASFGSAGTNPKGSDTPTSSAGKLTDIVELSDHAKATIEKAQADQAAAADLTLSFDEILAKRTDALTRTLTDAFAADNINLDDAVRLQVDKFGNVTTEGPWKKKIEKLFQDRPELAKELKTIAALNSLKAAQTALDLYHKEKGSAADSEKQSDAWTRYNIRSMNIQTLSGLMTLKDGKLRSAAVDYMDLLADPAGVADPTRTRQDIANRLA